jgi:hypothetical protein
MMRVFLLLLLLGLVLPASAQVTLYNYGAALGYAHDNEINQFDTARAKVSATDGTLLQLPSGTFSNIPECASSATCFVQYGSYWGTRFRQYQRSAAAAPPGAPFGGIAVYVSPSLENKTWVNHTPLFNVNAVSPGDPNGHTYDWNCRQNNVFCGVPKVIYNTKTGTATSGKFIVWGAFGSTPAPMPGCAAGGCGYNMHMFVCDTPYSGCVYHAPYMVPVPETGPQGTGDYGVLLDDDGTGYYAFGSCGPLSTSGTTFTGTGRIDNGTVGTPGTVLTVTAASSTTAQTTAATGPGYTTLTFASAPSGLLVYMLVTDTTTPAALPTNVVVSQTGANVVLTSAAIGPGVASGDTITFWKTLYPGSLIAGTGVAPNTVVENQISGTTGGAGTYRVSVSQNVASGPLTATQPCSIIFTKMDATNAAYGSVASTSIDPGEGQAIFKRNGYYYLIGGGNCNYCNAGVTYSYVVASSMAGPWSPSITQFSYDTCQSQVFSVANITAGGSTTLLLRGDHYAGPNPPALTGFWGHALANALYYPLQFDDTATPPTIKTIQGCGDGGASNASVVVPGVVSTTPLVFTTDQTSEGALFGSHCDIAGAGNLNPQLSRMQTFTPSVSGTFNIEFEAAQCNQWCGLSLSTLPGCSAPNQPLQFQVFATSSSCGSGTAPCTTGPALGTYTAHPDLNTTWLASGTPGLNWGPTPAQITGMALTGGTQYALVWSMTADTTNYSGCPPRSGWASGSPPTDNCNPGSAGYVSTYSNTAANPYPAGLMRTSSNFDPATNNGSGAVWTTVANSAMKFSVIGAGPGVGTPTGGFRRFGHH